MIWSRTAGDLPFSSHPDLRILLFNFSLALLVSLIFSLAPAAQFWRPNLAPALKQQAMTAGSGPLRFRRISVAVQIGLSILVFVGAGLFVRTLHNLKSLNVGFKTDHLVTFGVQPTLAGYRPDQTRDLDTRVLQTLAGLPGVRSAAGTTDPELADTNTSNNITLAGYTAKENEDMNVESPRVSPGYFSTMGMTVDRRPRIYRPGSRRQPQSRGREREFRPPLFRRAAAGHRPLLLQRRRRREARHRDRRRGEGREAYRRSARHHAHHFYSVSAGSGSWRHDFLCPHLAVAGKRGGEPSGARCKRSIPSWFWTISEPCRNRSMTT